MNELPLKSKGWGPNVKKSERVAIVKEMVDTCPNEPYERGNTSFCDLNCFSDRAILEFERLDGKIEDECLFGFEVVIE